MNETTFCSVGNAKSKKAVRRIALSTILFFIMKEAAFEFVKNYLWDLIF